MRIKAKQEDLGLEIEKGGIERQCEHEFFEPAIEQVEWADAVLSLACGAGVQFTAEKWPNKIVLPGLNTTFIGVVDEPGVFSERCAMCGDCILHLTGGICPITRCAKSLLNGPCGGSSGGKCEISKEIDCAWHLIVERLEVLGELDKIRPVKMYKDWRSSHSGGPRKMVREDLRI